MGPGLKFLDWKFQISPTNCLSGERILFDRFDHHDRVSLGAILFDFRHIYQVQAVLDNGAHVITGMHTDTGWPDSLGFTGSNADYNSHFSYKVNGEI